MTLTPEQERRLKAKAHEVQKPVEAVLDDFLADASEEESEEPKPKTGAELLAS